MADQIKHQPIITALRQICESYPAGTCLRELLQNADDAQATEIEYILDTNSYNDGPFLSEGLQQYHGPALLVRNNSVFNDEDFESLSSIGDSRKRQDATVTGKFGQGFNSVGPENSLQKPANQEQLSAFTGQMVRGFTVENGSYYLTHTSHGQSTQRNQEDLLGMWSNINRLKRSKPI